MKNIIKVAGLLVLGIALLIPDFSQAQFLGGRRLGPDEAGPKGQVMIYGSLDYSRVKIPTGSTSFLGTSTNAAVPIGIGYFLNNNDVLGINYAYSNQWNSGNSIYKQEEAGIWYSPSVTLGKYFALIAQFDGHYVWGSQLLDTTSPSSEFQNFKGYRLRAYPLFAVFLGGGWALKFKFAELSILQTKPTGGDWSSNFVAGISGSTFGAGISKNFNFHKKSDSR